MKKQILFLLLLFLSAANAEDWDDSCFVDEANFYAKILSGANFLQGTTINENKSTYLSGYMVGGSLGYCFDCNLGFEIEYAFRRNSINKIRFFGQGSSHKGYLQTSSYMVNLYWSLPSNLFGCTSLPIQPFIGAGLGHDFERMHSSNDRIIFDQKWKHFAWQAMIGLIYPILNNTEISLEYKFHQGGSHFNNHLIGIGLTYKFDFKI